MTATEPQKPPRDPVYERWRLQIFCVTWLAYFGFYLTRTSFSVAKIGLSRDGWTKGDMAWAEFGYLTAYAVGQFLFGMLGDKYGTRIVVLSGMLISIVLAMLCGFSQVFGLLTMLWCLQGLCQASGWAPLAKNVGQFFSQHERGKVMGLWLTNYAAGGFVAAVLAGAAGLRWGYGAIFWVPAGVLFLIWLICLFFQVNKPEDVGLPPIEQYHREPESAILADEPLPAENANSWEVIGEVLRSPMVWLLAAVYFLTKGARYLLLFWSPLYFSEKLATNESDSGFLTSLFSLGGPLGVVAGGYLSDRVFGSRRMPLCIFGLLGSAALLFVLDGLPADRYIIGCAMFAIGFLFYIPDSLVSGTAAIDFGTKRGASTAAGIINGSGSIAAIFGGTLPGLAKFAYGEKSDIWNYVFVIQAGCLCLAAVLLLPNFNALPPAKANGKPGTGKNP